jgi:hypothetical protein
MRYVEAQCGSSASIQFKVILQFDSDHDTFFNVSIAQDRLDTWQYFVEFYTSTRGDTITNIHKAGGI